MLMSKVKCGFRLFYLIPVLNLKVSVKKLRFLEFPTGRKLPLVILRGPKFSLVFVLQEASFFCGLLYSPDFPRDRRPWVDMALAAGTTHDARLLIDVVRADWRRLLACHVKLLIRTIRRNPGIQLDNGTPASEITKPIAICGKSSAAVGLVVLFLTLSNTVQMSRVYCGREDCRNGLRIYAVITSGGDRQHSKGARSFRGQKILQPGHPDALFLKKVDDFF